MPESVTAKQPAIPSWALNLLGFGLLIAVVIAVFFWQMVDMNRDLHQSTQARARMLAAIIEEHLANGELAQNTIDSLTTGFLRDKAGFIAYLNTIDPLHSDELTALAKETGLRGITVVNTQDKPTSGPAGWLSPLPACGAQPNQLVYDQSRQTVRFTYTGDTKNIRCIELGMDAHAVLALRQKTSLPTLLNNLSHLPGIRYVRISTGGPAAAQEEDVQLTGGHDAMTARVLVNTAHNTLAIGLDATSYFNRLQQLRRQFLLFAVLLLGLGLFFSWILYRAQQRDLERTRTFERLLARENEAAALGRATATIAHEVRNPLNAISMGLTRLSLESPDLDADQRQLVAAMEEAVRRAGVIITELQRFTRPLRPEPCAVNPMALIRRIQTLYQGAMHAQHLQCTLIGPEDITLQADEHLLAELLENLVKNSVEAQVSGGGFIRVEAMARHDFWQCQIVSGGYHLRPEEEKRLGEPYFTTKTRGTGLGLALCRKIAEAHGGSLAILPDSKKGQLTIRVRLPLVFHPQGSEPLSGDIPCAS